MSWKVYHRKKDNKYRIYSTVVDDYLTNWEEREVIENFWLGHKIQNDIAQINEWMKEPDEEV